MHSEFNSDEIEGAYLDRIYQRRFFNLRTRDVCREIGLNWLAALRLRDTGWLSFDPEAKGELEEPEEIELRFIGSLVAAGLDESQLEVFLEGLRKPYRYRIEKIYFDWPARRWRLLPSPRNLDLEEMHEIIDALKEEGEVDELRTLHQQIVESLKEVEHYENDEDRENP